MRDLAETRHEISRAQNPVETITKLRCPPWAGSSRERYWQGWLSCQFHGNVSYLSQASFALPITHAIYKMLRFQLYRDLTAHWGSSVVIEYIIEYLVDDGFCYSGSVIAPTFNWTWHLKRNVDTKLHSSSISEKSDSLFFTHTWAESSVTNDTCGGLHQDIGFNICFCP